MTDAAHSKKGGSLRSWNAAETRDCRLRVVNSSEASVCVLWVQPDGEEVSYRMLQPRQLHIQGTYTTHVWRLRVMPPQQMLAEHVGGDTTLEITGGQHPQVVTHAGYCADIVPEGGPQPPAEWGAYRTRAMTAVGIPITAWDCVGDSAVVTAADTLERMLTGTPPAVLACLQHAGCDLAIIGRDQMTSDIPAHNSLRGGDAADGKRTYDDGCRGVGGSRWIPTTSVGEENVAMTDDKWYASESILVHEFGHSVMDIGLAKEEHDAVLAAYQAAKQQELYDPTCYMASNPQEYWAEGTQAWFDATIRCDVNSGISTRKALKSHDPQLATLLQHAYGDGGWRYPHTAPAKFMQHGVTSPKRPWLKGTRRKLGNLHYLHWGSSRSDPSLSPKSGTSLLKRLFCGCITKFQGHYSKVV